MSNRELVPANFYDTTTDPVVFYDRAIGALGECTTLIDAWRINDHAAKIVALAKLTESPELELRAAEIRVRAAVKIGELCRDLDKAAHGGAGGGSKIPAVGKSKAAAIAEARLSTSTAHRYEQLPGSGRVVDEYLAACFDRQQRATIDGLLDAALAALPARTPAPVYYSSPARNVSVKPVAMHFKRVPAVIEQETVMVPVYRERTGYEEGIEAAAKLLDRLAKKQKAAKDRALLEQAAESVRALSK